MMTIALAVNLALLGAGIVYPVPATAGLQNPEPPHVRLPAGWQVPFKGRVESGAAIAGPNGELIYYPPYGSDGLVAYVQRTMDRGTRFVRAHIDDQRLDVALTSKNLLAVSYPSCDFWIQIKDTRQAVTSLMILLTRLDLFPQKSDRVADLMPRIKSSLPDHPFNQLNAASFSYRKATDAFYLRGDYEHQDSPRAAASTRALPDKPRWQNEVQLLGGNLQVVEDGEGSFVAKFTDRDGKSATYAGSPGDPANALLAILASITRVRT